MEPDRSFFAHVVSVATAIPVASIAAFFPLDRALAVQVTRGPYLQVATSSSMTLRWRTDLPAPSRVQYGETPGALNSTAADTTSTTEHQVTVAGLAADRRYFYAIGTDVEMLAGGDEAHAFRTAPEPGTRTPTRLWVIGDSGTADENAAAVRDAFAAYNRGEPPDVWLMLGDNAYESGKDSEYQAAVFAMYPRQLATTVLWPTRGNHDSSADYFSVFTLPAAGEAGGLPSGTESYYSFDHGDIHFICLDSWESDRSPSGPMATWLKADLAATDADWVIAYWHHPPYSKGSHDSDSGSDSGGRMKDMRENFVPILEQGRADLVLCGHCHAYERSYLLRGHYGVSSTFTQAMKVGDGNGREDGDGCYLKAPAGPGANRGTVYVEAGCSGSARGGRLDHPAMVVSLDVLGSMVIDIAGARMDARFIDDQGVVRDEFTIAKSPKLLARPSPRERGPRIVFTGPGQPPARASLQYSLPAPGWTRLAIYGVDGRRVLGLRDEPQSAGDHRVEWDGRDAAGRRTPPGVYFAELRWQNERRVARIVKLE
jgi:calcineurin-like phosphoesterase family protein/purple acid phosphatase-like protein